MSRDYELLIKRFATPGLKKCVITYLQTSKYPRTPRSYENDRGRCNILSGGGLTSWPVREYYAEHVSKHRLTHNIKYSGVAGLRDTINTALLWRLWKVRMWVLLWTECSNEFPTYRCVVCKNWNVNTWRSIEDKEVLMYLVILMRARHWTQTLNVLL
jgi:hypothetical protein